jgi:RNA polymerase sigma-70 factor (ECF subfamily)
MAHHSTDYPIPIADDLVDQDYEACARQGIRYAMALLHNESDAEEAVQEAFCRLHAAKRARLLEPTSFRASFLVTLRNHCIDRMRRRRIQREYARPTVIDSVPSQKATSDDCNETAKAIEQALSQLPESWRRSLELRVYGELSYDEIAEATGSTRNQIRTWIYRARRALEETLTANGILEPFSEKQKVTP